MDIFFANFWVPIELSLKSLKHSWFGKEFNFTFDIL